MIGQQAGRESECSGSGRRGLSEPSERESEWWGASDGGDSSWMGGSLKKNSKEETEKQNTSEEEKITAEDKNEKKTAEEDVEKRTPQKKKLAQIKSD